MEECKAGDERRTSVSEIDFYTGEEGQDMTVLTMIMMQDTFEDAPDITPRPRAKSPTSTRSLTERRTSSATLDRTPSGDGAADVPPTANGEELKVNGHTPEEEKAKRISTSEMDDVNLGDGESMCLFWRVHCSHGDAVTGCG